MVYRWVSKGGLGFGLIILMILLSSCEKGNSSILGSGSFEATEILVSSEVGGKVVEWSLEEGSTLQEGELIGVIDTTQLYLQKEVLARSGKGVAAIRPDVKRQTAALEIHLSDLKSQKNRVEKLLAAGIATQKELDDLETGISSVQSQLEAARSTLNKSGAQISAQSSSIDVQIAQIDDLIARSIIKSPISGTIIANYVQAGELTAQGRPLFRIADLNQIILRAYIPNRKLAKIKLGETVVVRVDGEEGKTKEYEGKITWISSKSEFTPKMVQTKDERANLVYAVKVLVHNDGYIRIGMYGEVIE